jgi:hypothetical protein
MTRSEEVHSKGFDLFGSTFSLQDVEDPLAYRKIKVGPKTLDDAVLNLGSYNQALPKYNGISKGMILQALANNDYKELRRISNLFYSVSGMYQRVCDYFAYLYRYDWYVVPEIYDDATKEEKILKDFSKVLNYLDNSYLKKICGDIALEVIKNGCYYGYIVDNPDGLVLQQLPIDYCRSRYYVGTNPAIEFNMRFFDTIPNVAYRMKVLSLFPEEFAKGYMLYKKGKLTDTEDSSRPFGTSLTNSGWYLLDPNNTVKFNFKNSDVPIFVNSIPAMLDLDAAQDLDRRKQMQKLLKIIVQKLPMDKNGDLIFDVDEARDIHNNAVEMLKRAIGVDVLTTFTDVDSIDLSDKNTTASQDDLEKVERTVYNNLGISKNIFNTDGNLSLEKSILNDESTVRNLLLQFNMFMDRVVQKKNANSKKYNFKIYFLETTQYNYQNLSKLYKEQTQLGYSKMLPQIALGHSQSFILNTAHFENEVLHLSEIMIPPLMSSTLSGEDILGKNDSNTSSKSQNTSETKKNSAESKTAGRPEKADDQKSEKTI